MGNSKNKEDAAVDIYSYPGKEVPKQYVNLIRSRWIRTYKKDNAYMKLVHPPSYYFSYNNYIANVLLRPTVKVWLAVLQEDDDVVLGFSVIEGTILHYVHVPKPYRRQHIGTMLVPDGIQWFTHLTTIGMRIWSVKAPNARFNPFI
jgi:hypothetical protein